MRDAPQRSALPVARAPRGTLQDHVYRQLCELILNGQIAPGQLITIQALAEAFGVSAMPVREALQRLTAARVLTVISSRSIGIPPLTSERLSDLRRVRLEVESLAAIWATHNISDSDIGRLEECVAAMGEAARSGDNKQYLRWNRAFHFGIYLAALRGASRDHRDPMAADQPLLSPAPRFGQLFQGKPAARTHACRPPGSRWNES
jgi:DNA-binding GntR family transcriptional regulator